jgi:hypothetical protein
MGAIEDAASEVEDEGMSTKKKVAAGAAIGVAVPAAVGVAKKLLGNGDDSEQGQSSQSRRGRSGSSSRTSRTQTSRSRGRTQGRASSASSRSSSSTSGPRERTKEQLYNQAKRLNIQGRSKMTKAQLQRAVRARS